MFKHIAILVPAVAKSFHANALKTSHILILFLLGLTLTSYGQETYYFKQGKSKVKLEKKEIVFLIDTTGTADETKVLVIVASKIDDNLKLQA